MNTILRRGEVFIPSAAASQRVNLVSGIIALVFSGLSIVLCLLAWIVWRDYRTRHHLNRMSTKLLLLCVFFSIPAGLAFSASVLRYNRNHLGFCRFSMWMTVFWYNALNWLQGCIPLNLVLALKRPRIFERYNVMRWYLFSTLGFSVSLATVPLIADKYRWDSSIQSCWIECSTESLNIWQACVLEAPLLVCTALMGVAVFIVCKHLQEEHRSGKATKSILNQLYVPAISDGTAFTISPESSLPTRYSVREIEISPDYAFTPKASPDTNALRSAVRRLAPRSVSQSSAPSIPSSVKNSPNPLSLLGSPCAPSISSCPTPATFSASPRAISVAGTPHTPYDGDFGQGSLPQIQEDCGPRRLRVAKLPMSANFGNDPKVEEARELRNTIYRISTYPVVHLFLAITGPIASLFDTTAANHTSPTAAYYLQFIAVAWIPMGYALCILFADASLCEGLKAWICLRRQTSVDNDLEIALEKSELRWSEISLDAAPSVVTSVIHVQSYALSSKEGKDDHLQDSGNHVDFFSSRNIPATILEENIDFEK